MIHAPRQEAVPRAGRRYGRYGEPLGLLDVGSTEPRHFLDDDTTFLSTYGTLIGALVRRMPALDLLRETLVDRQKTTWPSS